MKIVYNHNLKLFKKVVYGNLLEIYYGNLLWKTLPSFI